jgi:nicotinate-nucleotide pyrophosphorylase (carboxylating)
MTPEQTREAVHLVRARPGGDRILLESSGGITLHTVRLYAEAGVDLISAGALTHSAPAVDISLELTADAAHG